MTDSECLGAFLGRQDVEAFEALVRRHGPLVLRVCRDVLEDPDDAEDAFQATFLVLVRRAGAIRDPDSLGRWLHGVAVRVATRARADARRRKARERLGVEMAAEAPDHDELALRELRPVVHTELGRLPESLRAPLVLCYLEDLSYEDAARRLRLPLGTFKSRLSRGRELLRSRLTRRGIAVSTLLLATLLGERARAVPPDLLAATVNAGALVGRGSHALPPTIPSRVASLVERELEVRSLRRWASLAVLAVLLGGLGPAFVFLLSPAVGATVACGGVDGGSSGPGGAGPRAGVAGSQGATTRAIAGGAPGGGTSRASREPFASSELGRDGEPRGPEGPAGPVGAIAREATARAVAVPMPMPMPMPGDGVGTRRSACLVD
ncbi:RNA polymerase sigma factor [Tautonia sociabilis]|uniref:Sigma-70 family RNA polymerase sigma factor n=1 Tax=Tautonia sociabilis TaxID=2080755 RepID=A0A432MFA4_9BACT|nr:sigma-70 family RNA polymerase sigma factor [Tautonia sociabilis]RUL84646.1 sigma-70 family RNA polymerase sigma factor [Tautonia sociabilis]